MITCAEAGRNGFADEMQLDWATQQGRVLFSYNTQDFFRLHTLLLTRGGSHTGLILAKQQEYTIGEEMRRLLRLLNTRTAAAMLNQVEFLSK